MIGNKCAKESFLWSFLFWLNECTVVIKGHLLECINKIYWGICRSYRFSGQIWFWSNFFFNWLTRTNLDEFQSIHLKYVDRLLFAVLYKCHVGIFLCFLFPNETKKKIGHPQGSWLTFCLGAQTNQFFCGAHTKSKGTHRKQSTCDVTILPVLVSL